MCMVESNTNDDIFFLGKNFVLIKTTRRVEDLYVYNKDIKTVETVPIITGTTSYNFPTTNTTYILVFTKSL